MKQSQTYMVLFLVFSIYAHMLYCTSTKSRSSSAFRLGSGGKFRFSNRLAPEEKQNVPSLDQNRFSGYLPLWKGWVKYYHTTSSAKFEKPEELLINQGFFTQKVLKQDLLVKGTLPNEENVPSNIAYLNVPDKFRFFATVDNHFINISSDRKNYLTNKLESLNLDMVDPIQSVNISTTGVREIGKFKEGYCMDISSHLLTSFKKEFIPTFGDYQGNTPEHWLFCFESNEEMKSFGAALEIVLKAKESLRERPETIIEKKNKEENSSIERYNGLDANPKLDGYLVKINDWTQCTLKCGGGFSFQQWKCIPPKEGGKPCIGDLIRKKPCNVQPCPSISTQGGQGNDANIKKEVVVEDPIIKAQPINNRLQQNVDCYIRDEDVLHVYQDAEAGRISLPSRLIMNSKSISLFSDIEDGKLVFTFDITKTTFVPVAKEDCCFKLKSQNREFKMCGMNKCDNFMRSWARSFDLFKAKCYTGSPVDQEFPTKAPEISQPSPGGLAVQMEIDEDTAEAKTEILKKSMEQKATITQTNQVSEIQKQALKAIDREIDIEEMIRKEEMEKAQERVKEKLNEMKYEEKKKEKMEEVFHKQEEKQTEAVKDIKQKQEIKEIKKEADNEITTRRNELKKKIEKIRKQTERRTKLIQNKINLIRNKMTKSLVEATKQGNAQVCKLSWGNTEQMKKYCDDNIVDDFTANELCKLEDNFCFACCDNEFGKANVSGKDSCYNICFGKESLTGDWVKAEEKNK